LALKEDKFEELVGVPRVGFNKLVSHWSSEVEVKHSHGAPFVLSPIAQVFVFFLHIRDYARTLLIATIFHVSEQTIRNEVDRTVDFFYTLLNRFISMRTLSERLSEAVQFFNEYITFIMDGTEQMCHSSANMFFEGLLFSAKKSQHSITLLLIISPCGRVLYCSPCTYGSVVDSQLVLRSKKFWVKYLTPKDVGFADSGFKRMDKHGLKVYLPREGSHKHPIYKHHSSVRIKVENVIGQHKIFECLHQEIKEKITGREEAFLKTHTKKWRIVGAFINLKIDGWKDL
jgi:hypothetical protein